MNHVLGAKGFRPFFLLAGAFATVVIPLWVLVWTGHMQLMGVLRGMTWHAHEMLYGFTFAVIAGFLLTAVENWTGRQTLRGVPLLAVATVWLAARVGLLFPGWIGPVLDLAVIPLVGIGLARPLIATRNKRNLPFVGLLTVLWLSNLAVYADAAGLWPGAALRAQRFAVYLIAVIILVVAGRVVPMFTRNGAGDPSVHGTPWLDRIAIVSTAVVGLLQLGPSSSILPWVAGVAGVAVLARMGGWWTRGIIAHPLLWVLHGGHAAIGIGLCLTAAQPLIGPLGSGPLHTITVGGIGMLTLGMMSRVALGHTGRPLSAGPAIVAAFVALGLAAVLRVVGPWADPTHTSAWLWAAATAWSLGFAVFTTMYLPILVSPRADGKPG